MRWDGCRGVAIQPLRGLENRLRNICPIGASAPPATAHQYALRQPDISPPRVRHAVKTPSLLRGLLSFRSMTMISRVLGLARDIAINTAFGASAATDAFWVAFRIPNFMRRLFAEGSFSTAFVPVFTEYKQKRSHEELRELVACVAGTL